MSSEEKIRAEAVAEREADAKALPRLRAYREKLEKEAGALAVATRTYYIWLAAIGAPGAVVGAYAAWQTMMGKPPVVAWVVAGVLLAGVAFLARRRSSTERERQRHLEELHEKMLSTGRRIDSAERRLRG